MSQFTDLSVQSVFISQSACLPFTHYPVHSFLHARIHIPVLCPGSDWLDIRSPAASCILGMFSNSNRYYVIIILPLSSSVSLMRQQHLLHTSPSSGICILHHQAGAQECVSSGKGCIDFSWATRNAGEHWSKQCWNSVTYWGVITC